MLGSLGVESVDAGKMLIEAEKLGLHNKYNVCPRYHAFPIISSILRLRLILSILGLRLFFIPKSRVFWLFACFVCNIMRKEISLQEVRHRFVEEHRKQDHAATFKEHRQAAS